jgi:hypothetical protein
MMVLTSPPSGNECWKLSAGVAIEEFGHEKEHGALFVETLLVLTSSEAMAAMTTSYSCDQEPELAEAYFGLLSTFVRSCPHVRSFLINLPGPSISLFLHIIELMETRCSIDQFQQTRLSQPCHEVKFVLHRLNYVHACDLFSVDFMSSTFLFAGPNWIVWIQEVVAAADTLLEISFNRASICCTAMHRGAALADMSYMSSEFLWT